VHQPKRMPLITGDAYDTITLAAVGEALKLQVTVMGFGVYYVEGGWEPHWVNLYDPEAERCDCWQHSKTLHRQDCTRTRCRCPRGIMCKHLIRVLLDRHDPRLLAHLRLMRSHLESMGESE
jgi:hypothetical protein